MQLKLKQESKKLLSAAFCLKQDDSDKGSLNVEGGFEPGWAKVTLQVFDKAFEMAHEGDVLSFHGKAEATGEKTYRPYRIGSSNGSGTGEIYQVTESQGLFSKADYFKMALDGETYCAYPVGCGKEGFRTCVYCRDKQIAVILKSASVTDDLHHYDIFALDENSAAAAVLFTSYMYTVGPYKPGVEIRKGTYTEFRKTTNKFLLSKDDRSFESRC